MSAYPDLEFLVNNCGDRRVGTRGNDIAAKYVARTLNSLGYDMSTF